MINDLKTLKDEISKRIDSSLVPRDEEGRAIIEMNVRDDADFLSPYSANETATISSDVAEFLENSAMAYHPKERLTLKISRDCIDEREKIVYEKAIKNFFMLHSIESTRDLKRNAAYAVVMFIVGLIGFALMVLCESLELGAIAIECVDIFAWVFLWESVDLFFIERNVLKIRLLRNLALSDIKVVYDDKNK